VHLSFINEQPYQYSQTTYESQSFADRYPVPEWKFEIILNIFTKQTEGIAFSLPNFICSPLPVLTLGNRSPDIIICCKPGTVDVSKYLIKRLPVPHFRPFWTVFHLLFLSKNHRPLPARSPRESSFSIIT